MTKSTRSIALAVALFAGCTSSERSGSTTKPAPTARLTSRVVATTDPVIVSIRKEGLERSQVMDTLDYLCNVIGPRLTASPGQQRASEWTRERLESWGLSNAHLEPWGPFGRGWAVDRYSMRVTSPTMFIPTGYPRAWSPGFEQPISTEIVFLDAKTEDELADFEGELEGKIVLIGQPRIVEPRFEPLARRLTDSDLAKLAEYRPGQDAVPDRQPAEPASERRARFAAVNAGNEKLLAGARPTTDASTQPATTTGTTTQASTRRASSRRSATSPSTFATTQPPDRNDPFVSKAMAFAAERGAAVLVTSSWKGDGGTYFVQQAAIPGDPPRRWDQPTTRPRIWSDDAPKVPAQVMLGVEDYNRLVRIARRGETIRAELDLATTFHGTGVLPTNVIAEIPGTDLKDEVVMIGAHLDSWHSGTGATDNGIGSACAMEAIRILKALDLKPRRTIRVALWTGEEQGLFGSEAYVKQHFGYVTKPEADATTMAASPTTQSAAAAATRGLDPTEPPGGHGNPDTRPTAATTRAAGELVKLADYEKLSAYFNLDNGGGRIRGIYTQGNVDAAPIFRDWLRHFVDLDAKTVTLQNTGSTDHIPFDQIGLPGFQFIQDPMEYGSRTHHSNMDVYDRIVPDDAKQASTIMAAFIWNAANMPERFPRKPFVAPK